VLSLEYLRQIGYKKTRSGLFLARQYWRGLAMIEYEDAVEEGRILVQRIERDQWRLGERAIVTLPHFYGASAEALVALHWSM
jgi:hypothetical protein